MKIKSTSILATVAVSWLIMASVTRAQDPAPSPKKSPAAAPASPAVEAGEDAGDYTIISSLEVGYRGLQVDGDLNKYQSDLNYKAGPRLFDSSLFLRAREGKGVLFDTLLVTATGWGADPNGNLRMSVEKPKWYRFDANYRKFRYFRFLNNLLLDAQAAESVRTATVYGLP